MKKSIFLIGLLFFVGIISCNESEEICLDGFELCNTICTNTLTDNTHCGGCFLTCPEGGTCVNGVCQCPTGTISCSGKCTDLQSDDVHCGACNNTCPAGTSCIGGICG